MPLAVEIVQLLPEKSTEVSHINKSSSHFAGLMSITHTLDHGEGVEWGRSAACCTSGCFFKSSEALKALISHGW